MKIEAFKVVASVIIALAFCAMSELLAGESLTNPAGSNGFPLAGQPQVTGTARPRAAGISQQILIDKINFKETTLSAAVSYLRLKAQKLGVSNFNIVIPKMPSREPVVDLTLENVPIDVAIKYLADLAGLHVRNDPYATVLEMKPAAGSGKAGPTAAPVLSNVAISKDPISKIIVNKIDFSDVPLSDLVSYLRDKAQKSGAKSFNIVILRMPDPEPLLNITLANIPITAAIQYVAESASLKLRREGDIFVLF